MTDTAHRIWTSEEATKRKQPGRRSEPAIRLNQKNLRGSIVRRTRNGGSPGKTRKPGKHVMASGRRTSGRSGQARPPPPESSTLRTMTKVTAALKEGAATAAAVWEATGLDSGTVDTILDKLAEGYDEEDLGFKVSLSSVQEKVEKFWEEENQDKDDD